MMATRRNGSRRLPLRGGFADAILPVGDLLPLPALTLAADSAWRFVHGSAQAVSSGPAGPVKVFDDGGVLIGVGTVTEGLLQPEKVLPEGSGS